MVGGGRLDPKGSGPEGMKPFRWVQILSEWSALALGETRGARGIIETHSQLPLHYAGKCCPF